MGFACIWMALHGEEPMAGVFVVISAAMLIVGIVLIAGPQRRYAKRAKQEVGALRCLMGLVPRDLRDAGPAESRLRVTGRLAVAAMTVIVTIGLFSLIAKPDEGALLWSALLFTGLCVGVIVCFFREESRGR